MIPRYNTSPNFESNIRSPFYDIEEGLMYHIGYISPSFCVAQTL